MGLWSAVSNWLGGTEEKAVASRPDAASTNVADPPAPRETPASSEAAPPDPPAPAPWWSPAGETVIQPVRRTNPCDTGQPDAAEQLLLKSLEKTLSDPTIELPHLSHIAQQVMVLLRREDIGMPGIAAVIAQDQVLSADLLRRANSAAYGGRNKVTALDAALARLGLRGIRSFIIGQNVKHVTIAIGSRGGASRGETLWHQSVASAYVMASYAQVFGQDHEEAFIIGLLHDIGKVVVLRACHEAEVAGRMAVTDALFDYACQEYHEMMGEMIAEHWGLPERIGAVISRHHGPIDLDDDWAVERALIQLTDATLALLKYAPFVPYDLLALPAAQMLNAADKPEFIETLTLLPEVVELGLSDA